MVKKKVSSRSSAKNKSTNTSSKLKRLKLQFPKSKLSKSQASSPSDSNISGAELLNIANTSSKPSKDPLPNVDESSGSGPKIDTTTAEKLLNKESKNNDPEWIRTFALGLFSLIVLFWLTVLILSISVSFGPKMVEKNVTLISYTPVKTSFERFSQISGPSYSEQTSVLGYLRLETTTNSNGGETTTRYVVDDYDNKIRLIVDDKYSTHFSVNSKITYNVSGLYHNTLNGYVLDVENIVKQNRELIETQTQRLENVSEGEKAGITISLSQGWGKISNLIR